MANDWCELTLEESMDAIIDYRGKTPQKTNSGIPLITAKIIKSGRIETVNEFISEDDYDTWMRRGIPNEGDVVMTTEAPLGEIAQLDGRKIALAQRVITLRGKKDVLDNTFLKYLMISEYVQHQLDGRGTGTTVKGIKQSELRKVMLKFPSFIEQKAIAHILGSLDDKIELNRQMNETLEAMAQALFKSWFVDFDPVIDNALAAGNPIPDDFMERAEQRKGIDKTDNSDIQDLFPDEFEFTEGMGWIPKGWEVKPLDEVANYLNGLALQKFRPENIDDDYLPVVKIAQLREGLPSHDEKASINIKPEYIIDNGDVIFSWSGSLLVDIWCGGEAALNQHLFKVTSDKYPKWFYLNYTKHHLTEFQRIATDKAVTMGHIKRGHLKEALCLIPKNGVDDNVFAVFEDILSKQISSRIESQTLAKLRDTLLPKLMSGELRIPDATTILEDV